MIYTYNHDGQTYHITLEPQADGSYRAEIDGRVLTFQAQPLPYGGWHIVLDGKSNNVYTAKQADQRWVQADGQTSVLDVAKPNRRQRAVLSGELSAQMPGQVTAVLAQEGEQVVRGQTLLVMEAMKMEMRVAAPVDGTVKRLLVKVGNVVERGQVLAEIDS
ncbi:MAG: biotin/lipoyl-containing protein [Anaerolineae bacterium]